MTTSDQITDELARVDKYARDVRLTEAPWWADGDDLCWRLHGVFDRVAPQMGGLIPEQTLNKQILRAPKISKEFAPEFAPYWPEPADAEFIISSRTDLPKLLAAVEAVMKVTEEYVRNARSTAKAGVLKEEEAKLIEYIVEQLHNRIAAALGVDKSNA